MSTKGWSFECENPFFVYLKKHYCPYCNQQLSPKKVSKIAHSDAGVEIADVTVKGNVKFTHIEFFCSSCQRSYTVKETKENDF